MSEFPAPVYHIEDTVSRPGATGADVTVLMDVSQSVQGYVIAVGHDSSMVRAAEATTVGTDADTVGAEFVDARVSDLGALIGVILDTTEPFDNQTLGPGTDISIGRILYELVNAPDTSEADCDDFQAGPNIETTLEFVDFMLGSPPKDNVVVVDGESIHVDKMSGTLTFRAPSPVFCDPQAKIFTCGGELVRVVRQAGSGLFDYTDGQFHYITDEDDKFISDDRGAPAPIRVEAGEEVPVSFYYLSPPSGAGKEDDDDIQGLSMSARYGTAIFCLGSHSIRESITEAVSTEFVNVDCLNDASGAGGGELIVGLLVDALPPLTE